MCWALRKNTSVVLFGKEIQDNFQGYRPGKPYKTVTVAERIRSFNGIG